MILFIPSGDTTITYSPVPRELQEFRGESPTLSTFIKGGLLVERIGRATRTNIGIDFGIPVEVRHAGITTGLAAGVVRDQNPRPKGRGARRREARTRKGGK